MEVVTEPREDPLGNPVLLAPGRAKSLQTVGQADVEHPPEGGGVWSRTACATQPPRSSAEPSCGVT